MKNPELLSPCGSPETLQAAVKGGADAVYLGGNLFNARMNAKNFDDNQIKEAVSFSHENGVRVYITLNTLLTDRELKKALRYVSFLYSNGVDALITADLGLTAAIHRYFPDFELHASTQACGHSTDGAKMFADLGFSRMVAARELNQDALALLAKESPIEIEMFVHGAICVSHSGQCLMSSVIGERSGNRGLCAQPCRLPYNGHYPLSIKDMCLADHMQDILTMNIAALKIEGRMKPPGYVYGVTSIYRRLLDERRNATPDEIAYLAALFSRSGFTSGYFTGNMTKSMLGIRREEDKNAKIPPMPDVIFEKKEKIVLPARTHVLPEFISCKKPITKERFVKSARYAHANQIVNCEDLDIRYLPLDKFVKGKANGLIMPYPVLDKEKDKVLKQVDIAIQNGACHALITHLGQIPWFIGKECTLHGDYRLNITNGESACQYERLEDVILSPELTLPQIRDMHFAKSTIIYGHLPLMTLEKPVEEPHLKDRRGVVFPLVRAGGRDVVLNSVPVYMLDKKAALKKAGGGVHLMFIRETPQEVKQIMKAFHEGLPPQTDIKRMKE